jgi:RimJ/RimL family protein N-acetyltransferase
VGAAPRHPDALALVTTPRLIVRELTLEDAPFILRLLNDRAFIQNIGDRGVRTEAEAREYLTSGPLASYARHGFGLCAVTLAASGDPVGICGLLQRAELPGPDIGFAFLAEHRRQGYAFEAASAVHADARARLGLDTLLAIVNPDNEPSIRLLAKLGFSRQGNVHLTGERVELALFAATAPAKRDVTA